MKSTSPKQPEADNKPSLKSGSGSGYDFEDQVAAVLMLEMLSGRSSLSTELGQLEKLERQAADWEPFGDILLTFGDDAGDDRNVGCSVKSNRPILGKGASRDFVEDAWRAVGLPVFREETDEIAAFTARLANDATDRLNSLFKQARETASARLKAKLPHRKLQDFHDSFEPPNSSRSVSKAGDLLKILHHREFDFQEKSSRSEAEAHDLCREALRAEDATDEVTADLWDALLKISKALRVSGGEITRTSLSGRLRKRFPLRDDPADIAEWATIRRYSGEWEGEIEISLAGGLALPRLEEIKRIQNIANSANGFHILGKSGSGKSALVKLWAEGASREGVEVIWIKMDRFGELLSSVPAFRSVAARVRSDRAILVFDGIEACTSKSDFDAIIQTILQLADFENSPWQFVLTCQSQEWRRVSSFLIGALGTHDVLSEDFICGKLSASDTALVCEHYPAVASLVAKQHLEDFVLSPIILDIIARGQLSEEAEIACEADLVEWWWREQVLRGDPISTEGRVARSLASIMADELTTELSPDVAESDEAARELIRRHILRNNRDGRLRFDHELLADWSRTVHLRTLGPDAVEFMGRHSENPPWLRAIRLLSQYLIERDEDLERWRNVVEACQRKNKNSDRESLKNRDVVLDSWLDGIATCTDIARALAVLEADLLASECKLLRRLIHRLFYHFTVPHPQFSENVSEIDPEMFVALQREIRIPVWNTWKPFVDFLVEHEEETLEHLAVTVAEMVEFANRLSQCVRGRLDFWGRLGHLAILNAERELKREVAGMYRHGRSAWKGGGRGEARQKIYTSALLASPHDPERVTRLVLKAAGRLAWDDGDVDTEAGREWNGVWRERRDLIFGRSDEWHNDVEAWPDGPARRTSSDFSTAFVKRSGCLALCYLRPEATCEAMLGFLIDWPKLPPPQHGGSFGEYHGFRYRDWSESSAFYANGPFLHLLAIDFGSTVRLIVQLVNFATERYDEWWPYENRVETFPFQTSAGEIQFSGNDQIYNWGRIAMNTPEFVSSSLMALEKTLEMMLEKEDDVLEGIEMILREGKSLALAGMLVSLGKRHPDLFSGILAPLLFERQIFLFDNHAVSGEYAASMRDWNEPSWRAQQRKEWNELPQRKEALLQTCCKLMLNGHPIATALADVRQAWKRQASSLPEVDEDKLALLRWASNFDPETWQEVELANGDTALEQLRSDELRDFDAEEQHAWHQNVMMIPYQCGKLLEERTGFDEDSARQIWEQMQDFKGRAGGHDEPDEDEWSSMFRDHRHSLAGFCAVLLCRGRDWLKNHDEARERIINEVRNLLMDRPVVKSFTPEDIHVDGEAFLARCAVQCLSFDVSDRYWRKEVGGFVTSFRYGTVRALFDEAHHVRHLLGKLVPELEALAVSFAAARHDAENSRPPSASKFKFLKGIRTKLLSIFGREENEVKYYSFRNPNPKVIGMWRRKWLPRFARRKGPPTPSDWGVSTETASKIDQTGVSDEDYGRTKRGRKDYEVDMGVVLAAVGYYPALSEAVDNEERAHWESTESELLNAFLRTLPNVDFKDAAEWRFNLYEPDKAILEIVARRVFEGDRHIFEKFAKPLMELPPQAHQYVSFFFSSLFLRSLVKDPPETARLLKLWPMMGEFFRQSEVHCDFDRRDPGGLWRDFLFFGNFARDVCDECFAPLVEGLRDYYQFVIGKLGESAHDHVGLARIFCSKGGSGLIVESLTWFLPVWEQADSYFWSTIAEHSVHSSYLEEAWSNHFPVIRANANALRAFKILTLKLAEHHAPVALEIQSELGLGIS